jgi:predicted glycosyltransferase involved in capsule biosynthesis
MSLLTRLNPIFTVIELISSTNLFKSLKRNNQRKLQRRKNLSKKNLHKKKKMFQLLKLKSKIIFQFLRQHQNQRLRLKNNKNKKQMKNNHQKKVKKSRHQMIKMIQLVGSQTVSNQKKTANQGIKTVPINSSAKREKIVNLAIQVVVMHWINHHALVQTVLTNSIQIQRLQTRKVNHQTSLKI